MKHFLSFLVILFIFSTSAMAQTHRSVINVQIDSDNSDASISATHFTAALSGSQENPPVTTSGQGTGVFALDNEGSHYWITVTGLSGTISAAHFHNAATGSNGGVVRALTFANNTASGVWRSTDTVQPLTPELITALVSGRLYVNVHTAQNPGGEIRGQVNLSSGVGFVANLEGAQENPAVTTSGRGTGAFVWDGQGLHYWITVNGLSGTISAAHFHNAARGSNGGVVRALTFENNTASGVWTSTDAQPLTAALLGELWAGKLYVNVHSAQNPGGEIRGQVNLVAGMRFVANMTGAQENPPVTTSGRGTGVFALGATGLHYTILVNGLSGTISAAHFHNAATGTNGGVVRALTFANNTTSGEWKPSDTQALTPALLTALISGNLYVNVHTAQNPGGEIRGQVTSFPGIGFVAYLNGAQENPPVATTGQGLGAFVWSAEGLRYWATVTGLSGTISAAHFHNAAAGTNGGVVRALTFENNTTSGVWTATDTQPLTATLINSLWQGNLYVNVHTAQNPGGEIRGQVVSPEVPNASGLTVAFSRSIAGLSPNFAWQAVIGGDGKAKVEIAASSNDLTTRVVGVGGYYMARVTSGNNVLATWHSIPVQDNQAINLLLTGNRAVIQGSSPLSAGKPVAMSASQTVLSGIGPRVPGMTFRTSEIANGTLTVPVMFTNTRDLSGGALTLSYDAERLTFQGAQIGEQRLGVLEAAPGQVTLTFDGLASQEQTGLLLMFDGKLDDPGMLNLGGFFYDVYRMPILAIETSVPLDRALPEAFVLQQNYPNPFNPATQIRYALPQRGLVRLVVYNVLGQEVARLVDGPQDAGFHLVRWNADGMASGIYYYKLTAAGFSDVRKMLLVK